MSEDDTLQAEAAIGQEAERFKTTEIWRVINGKALQDVEFAKLALVELDPYQYTILSDLQNAISQLQIKARIAKSIEDYVEDAINEGGDAEKTLDIESED